MGRKSVLVSLGRTDNLIGKVIDEITVHNHKIKLGELNIQKFSDGESCVDFISSVRNRRVYILCSPNTPELIIQLELTIDAAKRASAKEIVPILPYFPYARQDKKDQTRGPIGAKVMAKKLEILGATTIITFDLHADQIQGFFEIPVIHLDGKYLFVPKIKSMGFDDVVLVSPDAGGGKRVKHVRDLIYRKYNIWLPIVFMDKTRSKANEIDYMKLIGDVRGKKVIMIDDMADTCGTLCTGANVLYDEGAINVTAIVTHGILSGDAKIKIYKSSIDKLIISDTLENSFNDDLSKSECVEVLSIANQIMLAIISIDKGLSIENLKENVEYI